MLPQRRIPLGLLAGTALLTACASYVPQALPDHPSLLPRLEDLRRADAALPVGFGAGDLVLLALDNNPDLLAARQQRGVARAQALQAGMLPNPQLGGAITPLLAGVGTTFGWTANLSIDIRALVTLSSRRRAAREAVRQVDAQLIWQEWLVIGQVRLLYVDLVLGEQSLQQLQATRDLLAARVAAVQQAVARQEATITALAPDLTALETLRGQINTLVRLQQTRRHQLNAALGLMSEVAVPLNDQIELPLIDSAQLAAMLPGLADRRPDLIALRLGYSAQDERVRGAILGQFPSIVFGGTGGSDNSNVRSGGPQISMGVPVFDRNQGNIAIETATRAQLNAEYVNRLNAATGQVQAMLAERAVLLRQREQLRTQLAETRRLAAEAAAAFRAGNLDERSYVDFIVARTTKEQEWLALNQLLQEMQVAIATLTGAGMRPIMIGDGGPQP